MKKPTLVLSVLLTVTSMTINAADQTWTKITESSTHIYYGKRGSATLSSDHKRIGYLERATDKETQTSDFYIVATTAEACHNGFGKIMAFDLEGALVEVDQVVADGGTVGAYKFDLLCGMVKEFGPAAREEPKTPVTPTAVARL